jgi:hypothetical protein
MKKIQMMKTRFAKISKDSENYMQYLENKSYSIYDELADYFIANCFAIQVKEEILETQDLNNVDTSENNIEANIVELEDLKIKISQQEEVEEQEEVSYNIEDKLSLEGIEINELKIETQDLKITTKKPKKEKSKKSTNE